MGTVIPFDALQQRLGHPIDDDEDLDLGIAADITDPAVLEHTPPPTSDQVPACKYNLRDLAAKLCRQDPQVNELALEASFCAVAHQVNHSDLPIEVALELAVLAVMTYDRARRDPTLGWDRPF